ncbi:hypothetical protein IWX90DRAFT_254077 [Phyllosticta citrichinensis]|uniref:C2H2-type domain-containing protein n=1 Tax=Phyllosticta citrichinensis TaxID=1130410 RepID=A0ABR1XRK6_9PEZI
MCRDGPSSLSVVLFVQPLRRERLCSALRCVGLASPSLSIFFWSLWLVRQPYAWILPLCIASASSSLSSSSWLQDMSQATFPTFAAYGAAPSYYPVVTEPDHAFRHLPTIPPQLDPHHRSPATRSATSIPRHGFLDWTISRLEPALNFEPHDVALHQERGSLVNHAFPPHPRPFPLSGDGDEIFADPIARFYRDADGPWSSVQATTSESAGLAPLLAPNVPAPRFRAPSDVSAGSETSALGRSAATALSEGSGRGGGAARGVRSVQGDGSGAASCRECDEAAPGEDENAMVLPMAMMSETKSRTKLFHCRTCHRNFKCASDLKGKPCRKDRRKHCKPFTCSVPGCARGKNLGFTTVNDLNRHKKSVHPEEMMAIHNTSSSTFTSTASPSTNTAAAAAATMTATAATRRAAAPSMTPSFRCVGPGCTRSGKIWPRRDNFKQHVRRVHGVGERDVAEIVRRSLYYPDGSAPADEALPSQMAGEVESAAMTQKSGGKAKRKRCRTTAQQRLDEGVACEPPSLSLLLRQDAYACASGPGDGISTPAKQCTNGADSLPGLRTVGDGCGCDITDERFALLPLPIMADGEDGENGGSAGMNLDLSFHYPSSRPTQSPTR